MNEPDESLRRIESLIAALDSAGDAPARQLARNLLQVVLDLHGLALARVAAITATLPDGAALLARLADDPHVGAVLLLHGLHPQDPAERVQHAVAKLNQQIADAGARVIVLAVDGTSARLLVQRRSPADPVWLRQQVEAAVVDAAPELEELVIEGLDTVGGEALPALAG